MPTRLAREDLSQSASLVLVRPFVDGKELWERVARIDLDGVPVWAKIVDTNLGGKPQRVTIADQKLDVRLASWTADGVETAIGVVKRTVDGRESWERLERITTPDGEEIWARPEPMIVDDRKVTNAMLMHQAQAVGERVVRVYRDDVADHNVGDGGRFGRFFCKKYPARAVPLG